jgi:antitoxin PrlF
MQTYAISMEGRVGERGQVTIPKPLRDRLGIRPGQVLEFTEERGRLVARKALPLDPVEEVYGIVEVEGGTDRMVERLRGKPDGA